MTDATAGVQAAGVCCVRVDNYVMVVDRVGPRDLDDDARDSGYHGSVRRDQRPPQAGHITVIAHTRCGTASRPRLQGGKDPLADRLGRGPRAASASGTAAVPTTGSTDPHGMGA